MKNFTATNSLTNDSEYGFYDYLSSEFPSQILVDVTEYCNLACIHCPHETFSKSEHYSGSQLDPDLHKKLIDEVAAVGKEICKFLRYTGRGETLIHPNIVEFIDYAKKTAGVPINFTTNGNLLKEEKAQALLDAGVDVFDFSIDAFKDDTYAVIRKKGKLPVVRANILKLLEFINKGGYSTKVTVSFIEQPLNLGEADDFRSFWKSSGAHHVTVRGLHSCAGSKEEIAEELWKTNETRSRKPCLYPWERFVLTASGHIAFCPAEWNNQARIIHFSKTSIKDLWMGEFMQGLRKAHMTNEFSGHKFCGQCPDWSVAPWPFETRPNYMSMMQKMTRPGQAPAAEQTSTSAGAL